MTQKASKTSKFDLGSLVKLWPANKVEPIIGLVVEVFHAGKAVSYNIISDIIYHKSENRVSHVDYDIDKEIDYAFPVSRRIFPSLIANSIVSVQPMPTPKGNIFSL